MTVWARLRIIDLEGSRGQWIGLLVGPRRLATDDARGVVVGDAPRDRQILSQANAPMDQRGGLNECSAQLDDRFDLGLDPLEHGRIDRDWIIKPHAGTRRKAA
jgi:hypothetical protein